MFFANDLLLSVYFIFISDNGNDVRQKANSSNFLEFKMGRKTGDTTCNISNACGSGTANKRTVQWWFKKFCKVDGSLGYEEHSGWPSEVNNQLRAIRAHPLTII